METRDAALKSLIKILEKKKPFDLAIKNYSEKVYSPSELYAIVSGTVKYKLTLDYFIEKLSSRKLKDLSYPVLNTLRLAIYELEFLKTPQYAVLNSYVELIKHYDKKASSFVNAILRNFLKKRDAICFPDKNDEPLKHINIKYSHPLWMVERWIKAYGIENTIKICEYNNLPPKLVIRVNSLKTSIIGIKELLNKDEISVSDSSIVEECLILNYSGNIKDLPGYNEGLWIVQGEASSLVAKVLDPKENEKLLDLCAAPGGKTTHIAALMNDKGSITAVDQSSDRLERVSENISRLQIKSIKTITADATNFTSEELYDRILIDAPCSNTGVLGKRVDARWNREPSDIKNLAFIQSQILDNATKLVKAEGTIVYSTCSIEPEENILNIQNFLKNHPNFEGDDISSLIPWATTNKCCIQILPSAHNTDGFFIARLKRKY